MEPLIQLLLSKKWTNLQNGRSDLKDGKYPGVYLLAYSDRNLEGKKISLNDIFYVGMSNSRDGVKQRLKQFLDALEEGKGHSAANRFYEDYAKGVPFSRMKDKETFFVASVSIRCCPEKAKRTPDDLRKMGKVAGLEYYVLAHIKEKLHREPKLNKK